MLSCTSFSTSTVESWIRRQNSFSLERKIEIDLNFDRLCSNFCRTFDLDRMTSLVWDSFASKCLQFRHTKNQKSKIWWQNICGEIIISINYRVLGVFLKVAVHTCSQCFLGLIVNSDICCLNFVTLVSICISPMWTYYKIVREMYFRIAGLNLKITLIHKFSLKRNN